MALGTDRLGAVLQVEHLLVLSREVVLSGGEEVAPAHVDVVSLVVEVAAGRLRLVGRLVAVDDVDDGVAVVNLSFVHADGNDLVLLHLVLDDPVFELVELLGQSTVLEGLALRLHVFAHLVL